MRTSDESTGRPVRVIFRNSPHSCDYNFLFISKDLSRFSEYAFQFSGCTIVSNFEEAKSSLLTSFPPELIVIDIPLNRGELYLFKTWLMNSDLRTIPIIYNEAALEKNQLTELFVQKLTDDIVNLEKDYKRLPRKANFLAKVRIETELQHKKNSGTTKFQIKRSPIMLLLDITFSSIFIICLIPLFLIIALAIKLESRGPVFYSSPRAGMGFRIFNFYKFRTMIVDADKKIEELGRLNLYSTDSNQAKFFKIANDPRITKVGAFLRNTSLDELPQLVNVLKGDMSLVGNRPLPLYEASTLTTNDWAERFMAPAGMTGLWQISKRGKPEMSSEERIQLDIIYARNRSLMGDLKILFKTPAALKQRTNV